MTTILVVDDLADAASAMAMLFESRGFNCVVASNGPEALNLAQRHEPQIVVMDLSMPTMDGFSTAKHIRELQIPQPYLIALSALEGNYIEAFTDVAGFDFYIRKPAASKEILELVDRLNGQTRPS